MVETHAHSTFALDGECRRAVALRALARGPSRHARTVWSTVCPCPCGMRVCSIPVGPRAPTPSPPSTVSSRVEVWSRKATSPADAAPPGGVGQHRNPMTCVRAVCVVHDASLCALPAPPGVQQLSAPTTTGAIWTSSSSHPGRRLDQTYSPLACLGDMHGVAICRLRCTDGHIHCSQGGPAAQRTDHHRCDTFRIIFALRIQSAPDLFPRVLPRQHAWAGCCRSSMHIQSTRRGPAAQRTPCRGTWNPREAGAGAQRAAPRRAAPGRARRGGGPPPQAAPGRGQARFARYYYDSRPARGARLSGGAHAWQRA